MKSYVITIAKNNNNKLIHQNNSEQKNYDVAYRTSHT